MRRCGLAVAGFGTRAVASLKVAEKLMHESPRLRRLRHDHRTLERLRSESTVFRFSASGDPPQRYVLTFYGRGLGINRGRIQVIDQHKVEIKLGASYPRTMPELRWMTPIHHPNISEIGMVCLGGYGAHWAPSVQLEELCQMLWDMVRYHNYDIRSPYNRDAALWVSRQTDFVFPLDERPLRDLRVQLGRQASGDVPRVEAVQEGPGKWGAVARACGFLRRRGWLADESRGEVRSAGRAVGGEAEQQIELHLGEPVIELVADQPGTGRRDATEPAQDPDILYIE